MLHHKLSSIGCGKNASSESICHRSCFIPDTVLSHNLVYTKLMEKRLWYLQYSLSSFSQHVDICHRCTYVFQGPNKSVCQAVSGHLAKMSRELLMHPLLSFATQAWIYNVSCGVFDGRIPSFSTPISRLKNSVRVHQIDLAECIWCHSTPGLNWSLLLDGAVCYL